MVHTYYTYWNADVVRDTFQAIAMIFATDDMRGLLKVVAIAGGMGAICAFIATVRVWDFVRHFLLIALLHLGLLAPKVELIIKDERAGQVYTVRGVPAGLGVFASEISHVGMWLTKSYETFFTPIDDLRFSKTGMVFGARLVEEVQRTRINSAALRSDMTMFVKSCVNPELLDYPKKLEDLINSRDVWGLLGQADWLNPARVATINFSGGAVAPAPLVCSCPQAYQQLGLALQQDVQRGLKRLDRRYAGKVAETGSTFVAASIAGTESFMMEISRSSADALKQAMMMNLVQDSQSAIAAMRGDTATMNAIMASTIAQKTLEASSATMRNMAEGSLPVLRNVIEIIALGIFPIIGVLLVLSGSGAGMVGKTYLSGLLWVQLWAPLYAVVNSVVTRGAANNFTQVVMNELGTGPDGPALSNGSALLGASWWFQSAAGWVCMLVPIVAGVLAKIGTSSVGMLAGAMAGPGHGAASSAAQQVAQGNLSAGNVQWGNVSQHTSNSGKLDRQVRSSQGLVSMSSADGFDTVTSSAYGGSTGGGGSLGSGGGGGAVIDQSARVPNLGGISGNFTSQASASVRKALTESEQSMRQTGLELTQSVQSSWGSSNGWRQTSSLNKSSSASNAWRHDAGVGQDSGHKESMGTKTAAGSNAGVESNGRAGARQDSAFGINTDIGGLANSLRSQIGGGGKDANAKKGGGAQRNPNSAGAQANTMSTLERGVSSKDGAQTSSEGSIGVSDQMQSTAKMLESAIQGRLNQIQSGNVSESFNGEANELRKAQGLAQKFSASLSNTKQLQDAKERLESASGAMSVNTTKALNDAIVGGVGLAGWNGMSDSQKAAFAAQVLSGTHDKLTGQTKAGTATQSLDSSAVHAHHADAMGNVRGRAGELEGMLPGGGGREGGGSGGLGGGASPGLYDNGRGRFPVRPANRPHLGPDSAGSAHSVSMPSAPPLPENAAADRVWGEAAQRINASQAAVDAGKARVTTEAVQVRNSAKEQLEKAEPIALKAARKVKELWSGDKNGD